MWGMYQSAQLWKCRPSDLADIDDGYVAYCFDEAVSTWGNYITKELEKIKGKKEKDVERKRHNRFLQLIDAPDAVRFRSMRKSNSTPTSSTERR
jgi:hypothetical protein